MGLAASLATTAQAKYCHLCLHLYCPTSSAHPTTLWETDAASQTPVGGEETRTLSSRALPRGEACPWRCQGSFPQSCCCEPDKSNSPGRALGPQLLWKMRPWGSNLGGRRALERYLFLFLIRGPALQAQKSESASMSSASIRLVRE